MTRILIADDHDLVCEAIAAYLATAPDFDVSTASNIEEALATLADGNAIDLAIFDYKMPGMDGLDGLRTARQRHPHLKIALMSGVASVDVVREALSRGAQGYLPKSLPAGEMISAVRRIIGGDTFVPFDLMERQAQRQSANDWNLSARELQVLEKLCLGHSNKQIAEDLGVKLVTAKLHVANIMSKMSVENRTQAVVLAKEHHLF